MHTKNPVQRYIIDNVVKYILCQSLVFSRQSWKRLKCDDWFDGLLCLTPLSAIFQLYHGDQF
jgi:hypothetical protein